jgi:class 3 adenylate cyclase
MPVDRRRERKTVTVVFCDLVGFTTRAESLDPEDVEAILRPYHERVRSELERHGGTVEKFIGDAVMALFGAPIAHEDDPERAVRAALAIRDFALDEGLELRVGVTTGEALISLDANPAGGEGMAAGDVVNTASRLQTAAPVNGILVDETTSRATRTTIEYRVREAVQAKGKAEPIAVWEATAARSRFGVDVAHHARTELVGRERELSILRDAFERACHERIPQLVTLIAVPGMGKSRLVFELQQIVEADSELITWRQGRCLAYGAGIAFWALGEVVKAQAGILERDSAEETAAKLHAAVVDAVTTEDDARWVESHLRPLVGLETETGLGGDRRGQAFAAWRRFLEALAERRPLVLVVEDLHWADDGLLDFVDELMDWLSEIPLLLVCTARPELLERRPGWGGGKMNASTIGLAPLGSDLTALLISRVLDRPLLPVDIQHVLLERAEGNPLFAEQFAQLYVERGSAEDLPLPETVQGVLAARLDGLSGEEKALLQDAAVIGKIFWTGALHRDAEATPILHALERKGFLTRQRRTSVEGESEWAFAHMLMRDAAYGQIPRAERARKHRAMAEWLDGLGRPDDHAELIAYHWRSRTRASARLLSRGRRHVLHRSGRGPPKGIEDGLTC